MMIAKPLDVLFKVRYIVNDNGCWDWIGNIGLNGYGRLRQLYAHVVSYFLNHGYWPSKSGEIDHLCRNRKCVNPEHLEFVTGKENQHRGFSPSGINYRKTHCNNGHAFTEENIIWNGKFKHKRRCRKCYNEWNNARYWKEKNAVLV